VVQANRFHSVNEHRILTTLKMAMFKATQQQLHLSRQELIEVHAELPKYAESAIRINSEKLAQQERIVAMLDPRNTLKRGYSITTKNGKALHTFEDVKPGDVVFTQLHEGSIVSTVQQTQSTTDEQNTEL
jgi:exodeoxyribonuclease VII large subunit